MDIHAEPVFILALSCASKKLTTLDDEFRYVFQGSKTFLDWLLSLGRGHQICTMAHAAQKAPETKSAFYVESQEITKRKSQFIAYL